VVSSTRPLDFSLFAARFTPPRAGTFIYHAHLNDELQLCGGLYGPLIVLEPGAKFDPQTDQIFIISGWGGPRSEDPKTPATVVLNGSGQPPTLHWRIGQRYRLRLINISSGNLGWLSLSGANGFVKWTSRGTPHPVLNIRKEVVAKCKAGLQMGEGDRPAQGTEASFLHYK
jgi:FtsP/CotA-like multicopper oxidase with cupredoxin domain